jgi:hypothetical protein
MSQKLMPGEERYYSDPLSLWPRFSPPSGDPELVPLRRQVMAIISSILEDPAPEGAGIRNQLRGFLAQNVGFPEKALLAHLQSLHGDLEDGDLEDSDLEDSDLEDADVEEDPAAEPV